MRNIKYQLKSIDFLTLLLCGSITLMMGVVSGDERMNLTFQSLPPPECFSAPLRPEASNHTATSAPTKTDSGTQEKVEDKELLTEDGVLEWIDHQDPVTVHWQLGTNTCSSRHQCLQTQTGDDVPMVPQITPLTLQYGTKLRFATSTDIGSNFSMIPFKVDEQGFEECDNLNGTALSEGYTQEAEVPQGLLLEGVHYFIVSTMSSLYKCEYGLRLMVTVKTNKCSGVGENTDCWNKGRCLTSSSMSTYSCACCHGFTGKYCGYQDGCYNNPCVNNGTCFALGEDENGAVYKCICPFGYYGRNCETEAVNLCEINRCLNGGSCLGNKTDYTCHCQHGYHGHHCEVNENDCRSNPCVNGICVDQVGGYQCYCTPGYGGRQCEKQYNLCAVSPCKNHGVCVQGGGTYYCDCPRGFNGHDCSVKVDLCNPSPCVNALECVDFGQSMTCTCLPGYAGSHCEININECESSPCHNGGKCIDMAAAYRCVCPHGIHGSHCEFASHQLYEQHNRVGNPDFQSPWKHRTRLQNLILVTGTLGGALLLAFLVVILCYCKVNQTYRQYSVFRHNRGYKRQLNEGAKISIRRSSISHPRPSTEAIIAASVTSSGHHGDSDAVPSYSDSGSAIRQQLETPLRSLKV